MDNLPFAICLKSYFNAEVGRWSENATTIHCGSDCEEYFYHSVKSLSFEHFCCIQQSATVPFITSGEGNIVHNGSYAGPQLGILGPLNQHCFRLYY